MHKFFAKTQFIGKNVIYLPQCHSTNTEMQTFLKKTTLEEGTVVMADFQIKGRGQLNGRWISQKEKNILMSILLNPTFLSLHQQYYLTIIQGLAITDALGHFIANDVKIKWPNDIYVGFYYTWRSGFKSLKINNMRKLFSSTMPSFFGEMKSIHSGFKGNRWKEKLKALMIAVS